MFLLQLLAKRSITYGTHSLKNIATKQQSLSARSFAIARFGSNSKRLHKQADEGEKEEMIQFSFQKEGIGQLQNQILLKDYERIMQNEDEIIQDQASKIELYEEIKSKYILKTAGLAGNSNSEIDDDIVVMEIDIEQLKQYHLQASELLEQKEYQKALEYLFKCMISDHEGFCVENCIFREIGLIYSKLSESDKAIRYYHKQLEGEKSRRFEAGIKNEKEGQQNIFISLVLLAQEYEKIKKYSQSCNLYELSLKIKFDAEISLHYAQLLFHKKNDYIEAVKYFEKAYSQCPDFIQQSAQVCDYFASLIILRKYLRIFNLLEWQINLKKYSLDQQQQVEQKQIQREDIIKDWRLLYIYRMAYMHIKKSFNFYASFVVQVLQEVVQIDYLLNNMKSNLSSFPELQNLKRDETVTFYKYQYDINHIEILQTLLDCIPLYKNKVLQDEINELPKVDLNELQRYVRNINENDIANYLSENVIFKSKEGKQSYTTIQIKRQDLYIALFPFVKQMLRFMYSHFHKNGNYEVAEYFILEEFKINKSDLSTLAICKKLYEKDNLKLYTGLLIEFYEANKDKLSIDATELLLEIYNNCKKLRLYDNAAKYLHACLISKQNSLNLETKRQLIVHATYLFYFLEQKDLFISYYNQIKNLNRYPQLKIFYHFATENYEAAKQLLESNYVNRKNNLISSNLLFYEYYIICVTKLGYYQNLDSIIKKFINESSVLQNRNINFILYSKLLFLQKQFKEVISFLNLAMENSSTSLGGQGSDNLYEIHFYITLSYFYSKQYEQALRHAENFMTLYNAKNPYIPYRFQHMEKYIYMVQIIINAKKQQSSISQSLLEAHGDQIQVITGKILSKYNFFLLIIQQMQSAQKIFNLFWNPSFTSS